MAALDDSEAHEPSLHRDKEPAPVGEAAAEESTRDHKEWKVEEKAAADEEAPTTTGAAVAASDADDTPPPRPPPPKPKPPCSSCGADSRYQCPRCGERSCSAPCVGKHKEATGCTGKRDRAAFVPVSAMNEATLASDVGLLEEVERAAAAAQRGAALPPALADAVAKAARGGTNTRGGSQGGRGRGRGGGGGRGLGSSQREDLSPSPSLPPHLQQLVAEAARRGVRLRLAPPGFDARKHNATRFDGKLKKMHWHLEWRFFSLRGDEETSSAASSFVTREDRRVREDAPLGAVLLRHLEAGSEGGAALLPTVESSTTAAKANHLSLFRALLRLDGRPANSPGWLEFSLLDEASITLAELLRGRTVDERPVVALVVAASSAAPPAGEVVAFARAPAVVPLPPPSAPAAPPSPPVAVAKESGEAARL